MKEDIQVLDHATDIMKALQTGVLITGKADGRVNPMTISWGVLGIEWSRPIFTTFVRTGRFTHGLIEKNPEFTVSVPFGAFDKKILGVCGSTSGRETDKIERLGLTLVEPSVTSVPGIKELPLILECRVVYKQDQDLGAMSEDFRNSYYPHDIPSSAFGSNKDTHTAYYGEVVAAYIVR